MFNLLSMVNGLGSIYEIDSSITLFEQLLSTSSRPGPLRLLSVVVLASLRSQRYKLSNQSEDFDKIGPNDPSFLALARALVKRSTASNQPEDAIYAAKYLRYLRDQPHGLGVSGFPRQGVTASLVNALENQVELNARNVMQCIEEMAVLYHDILTLEASDDYTTSSITRFAMVVSSKITLWAPDQSLNQAIECLRLAREHRPDMVTMLALIRSMAHRTPEYSEEAIYRACTSPGPSSEQDHFAEITAVKRFRFFGSIEGPETSSGNSSLSRPLSAVSLGRHADPEIEPTFEKLELLDERFSEIRIPDIMEIGEAVEKGRTILFATFQRTNKIEYLNDSINIHCQVFERHRTQDLDEVMKLLSQCVDDRHLSLPDRFLYTSLWAFAARNRRHPSVSKAYESALQHATFAKTLHVSHKVPPDYASYQVDLHLLEEAVETLERGRALLWSEMRRLRASIDQLQKDHPQLGHEFEVISRDLEELTKSIPPSHRLSIDDDAADDLRAVDPFGRLLLKQRGLLKECDDLISRIQALPGFDNLLTPPSFNTLRSAASSGPVIIINHSMFALTF
ncbi:hypothetical protein EDB85DRAFT_1894470 [Lactarius pseudohatsudake]|nr:hypothetical protein EDB85DRAFT_1894470 [Lactarius pseudohatsudake]